MRENELELIAHILDCPELFEGEPLFFTPIDTEFGPSLILHISKVRLYRSTPLTTVEVSMGIETPADAEPAVEEAVPAAVADFMPLTLKGSPDKRTKEWKEAIKSITDAVVQQMAESA